MERGKNKWKRSIGLLFSKEKDQLGGSLLLLTLFIFLFDFLSHRETVVPFAGKTMGFVSKLQRVLLAKTLRLGESNSVRLFLQVKHVSLCCSVHVAPHTWSVFPISWYFLFSWHASMTWWHTSGKIFDSVCDAINIEHEKNV